MSISRKNWSALSTLTRQWTVEDEEEVEREKRRKERSSSSAAEPDEDAEPQTSSGSADAFDPSDNSGGGLDQMQMDFVEMLRVRDESRRMRHVETLRRHKEGEGGTAGDSLDGEPDVELHKEKQDGERREKVQQCVEALKSPGPSVNSEKDEKPENKSRNQDSTPVTPTKPSRKFVSAVSFSFDKSPSSSPASSRVVSPLSPRSPPSLNPWAGQPCSPVSPTRSRTVSPTTNGDAARLENETTSNFEPATKPAFTRQSSRTISFRMIKKKEEESKPLQRSASVRVAGKTHESNTSPEQEDEQKLPFQRNSRQRISSRSIQEKMERLAQASQKWETVKSPTVPKTRCLADEVSRKRELFEKEQEGMEKSHTTSKQDFRSFSSGISERINRWVHNKTSSSSHSPSDLKPVNISSKKSLFEKGAEQKHK